MGGAGGGHMDTVSCTSRNGAGRGTPANVAAGRVLIGTGCWNLQGIYHQESESLHLPWPASQSKVFEEVMLGFTETFYSKTF